MPSTQVSMAQAVCHGLRVLIVDDNVDAADSLADLLNDLGYDCRVCYDGSAALVVAGEHSPEVVLLDIGLPEIDGYEVARRLRATRSESATLVALTGYGQASDRKRVKEAGFAHHLVKPVKIETFLQLLEGIRGSAPQ